MDKTGKTALLACIALCLTTGAIGSAAAGLAPDWYASLSKPAWNPPDRLFAPVWTALYLLMAVALWLVWKTESVPARKTALVLFGVQLVLNAGWPLIFFGWRSPGVALAELLILWLAVAATLAVFAKQSRTAAWLLAPYLAWLSFAGALNFAIWRLNPGNAGPGATAAETTVAPR
ncbi:MAG: tryptophan-rich sensory protein [Elusimicrobiaceae bacterium]|nr:tryptophan-rich sensory protein [Elusimicrobiaceae bacterium]